MISGDHVTAKVGAMPVALVGVQKWNAQGSVVRLDGQTALDAGYSHPAAGTRSVKARISFVIDITTGDLTSIEEGTIFTSLGLYADASATDPIYLIPTALVLGCSGGGEMGGKFSFEAEVENVGSFTFNDPN